MAVNGKDGAVNRVKCKQTAVGILLAKQEHINKYISFFFSTNLEKEAATGIMLFMLYTDHKGKRNDPFRKKENIF